MTREEVRKAAEVMLAYADGKDLQICGQGSNEWVDVIIPVFNWELNSYRIKPEPRYRSFKNTEECFDEMKKHVPFGWVVNEVGVYSFICGVRKDAILLSLDPMVSLNFRDALFKCAFVDGEPFGVKEE